MHRGINAHGPLVGVFPGDLFVHVKQISIALPHGGIADALVERIVAGWPSRFDARRAAALGFKVEATFDDIIRVHIEEDLGGKIVN